MYVLTVATTTPPRRPTTWPGLPAPLDWVFVQISSQLVLWIEWGQRFLSFELGNAWKQHPPVQRFFCPDCWQTTTHALLESSLGSSSPVDFLVGKGACLLHTGPQDWDAQIVAQPTYSPEWGSTCRPSLVSRSLPFNTGLHMMPPLFLSYRITWGAFLQLWLYSSSSRFPLVFCENCSTLRCIFDVFLGGGGWPPHILLLCNLELLPWNHKILTSPWILVIGAWILLVLEIWRNVTFYLCTSNGIGKFLPVSYCYGWCSDAPRPGLSIPGQLWILSPNVFLN